MTLNLLLFRASSRVTLAAWCCLAWAAPLHAQDLIFKDGFESFRLADPLQGTTLGTRYGGALTPQGWQVLDRTDRLWYSVPRLVEGSVEFTIAGVTNESLTLADNELLSMYEAGYGIVEPIPYAPAFRDNHYQSVLRVYGMPETGREGQQKLVWRMCPSGAPGYGACGCASFTEEPFGGVGLWNGTPERLRIEWVGGHTRFYRNAVLVLDVDWSPSGLRFGASELHISLGSPRATAVATAGLPVGMVFTDVLIKGTVGPLATCPAP